MPACVRCGKVQATAEVTRRREHGAYTCKDVHSCKARQQAEPAAKKGG